MDLSVFVHTTSSRRTEKMILLRTEEKHKTNSLKKTFCVEIPVQFLKFEMNKKSRIFPPQLSLSIAKYK